MNAADDNAFRYHDILLAYDGSSDGRCALHEGAELARRCQAHAHLLAVVRLPLGVSFGEGFSAADMLRDEMMRAQAIMDAGVAELRTLGIECNGHMRQGEPVAVIAEYAREVKADLIVLGHRRREGVTRWWHGATSATLLDSVSCSVLVAQSAPPR